MRTCCYYILVVLQYTSIKLVLQKIHQNTKFSTHDKCYVYFEVPGTRYGADYRTLKKIELDVIQHLYILKRFQWTVFSSGSAWVVAVSHAESYRGMNGLLACAGQPESQNVRQPRHNNNAQPTTETGNRDETKLTTSQDQNRKLPNIKKKKVEFEIAQSPKPTTAQK